MKLERNAESPRPSARPPGRRIDLNAWAMAGVLLFLWLTLAVMPATRGVFLTERNLATLLTQNAHILVIAVGMTMVIIIRGIDLSVGAGVALTGVVAALLQLELGWSAPLAIGAALAAGAAIGVWQGLWISRLGIPAFVVTLAGFNAFRGLALVLSDARGLAPMREDFSIVTASLAPGATWALVALGLVAGVALTLLDAARRRTHGLEAPSPTVLGARLGGQVLLAGFLLLVFGGRGMPVPVLVAALTVLGGVFLTQRTRFGRHVYAVGGNPEAARLAGVDVKKVTLGVYVLVGILTGVAGVLLAGRVNGVTPGSQGQLLELDVITAVVIGGTSLLGGRGSIVGTMLGALVFGTLANGMNLLGVDSNWQLICKGLILMTAVLFDVLSKNGRVLYRALAIVVVLVAVTAWLASRPAVPRPQVAFLLSTLQEERYQKDQRYFEARAKALGVRVVTLAADNDNAKQIAQVEDALTRGARVLVIQPTDSQAASSYVRLAHERGAKVVAYDRTIASPDLDFYVSHDSYKVGVLQAEAAIAATGGKGRFVILSGQAGHSVATEITRGYDETLRPYLERGDLEIVMRQSHSAWSPEQALRTVEDALARGGKVDAILANNSGMARGAVQALAAAGLGSAGVFVAGADADAANVDFVCQGKQTIEVLKDIQPLAETAADVAAELLRPSTHAARSGRTAAVPVEVIRPADVKPRLIDSGFLSASEVPSCPK